MFSLKLLCLIALCTSAFAYQALSPPEKKPAEFAHLEGCYLKSLNRVIPYHDEYKPTGGPCESYTCGSDGMTLITGCGSIGIGKGCERAPGDKSKQYPKCCDGIRCRKPDGTFAEHFPH